MEDGMNEKLNELLSQLKIKKGLLEDAKQAIDSYVRGSSKYWQSQDRIRRLRNEVDSLERLVYQETGQKTLF